MLFKLKITLSIIVNSQRITSEVGDLILVVNYNLKIEGQFGSYNRARQVNCFWCFV